MKGRWPVTLLAVVGALLAGIGGQVGGSSLASVGWAVAAGVGLSLMLRGFGLRVVGILLVVVSIGGLAWSVQAAQWVPLAGFTLSLLASVGFVVWGPTWRNQARDRTDAPADLWKAMDEGADPTGEQGSPAEAE